ncbi:MAG: CCA tRNA nucleotidyltransferase [Candidatus Shapirobacteria bacterium]|jgi:tRNA nucleotidyltransferase/poly(A) polymerase
MEIFDIPAKVMKLVKKFQKEKASIYIVGGATRDLLLKREVKDWDFATNLTPMQMKKMFPKNSFCNNEFGTFSIIGENKEIFEVTTFRTEGQYSDKRHPDKIKFGKTIEEDLGRRDFTINAIALEINDDKGKLPKVRLIDLFGGKKDIENKTLRTVGKAEDRFNEDALRMMRAVRIANDISFAIEEKTFEAIIKLSGTIKAIAAERIKDELFKILKSDSPVKGIELLWKAKLMEQILPEPLEGIGIEQKGHHVDDVWTHNLKTLGNCQTKDPITRLACLLHDVGKPRSLMITGKERTFYNHEIIGSRIARAIGQRLRLSKAESDKLFRLVRWHMFSSSETQTDKAVRRFIRKVTLDLVDEMIDLRRADRLGSGAKETSWRWELFKKRIVEVQKQPFSIKDLKINGLDVMEILNEKPGKKIGDVLKAIFLRIEEQPGLNEREILLKMVEEYK